MTNLKIAPGLLGSVVAAVFATGAYAQNYQITKDMEVGLSGTQTMHVDMLQPNHAAVPTPVIFMIHAGGWKDGTYHGSFGRGNFYDKGYTIVSIEYHPAGGNARWPVQLYDCLRAIRWMRSNAAKYNVDPDRFAVGGDSAGAHLAACVGLYADDAKYQEKDNYPGVSAKVQAVFCGDGPLDIITSEKANTNPKYRWNIENLIGGGPDKFPEAWSEACIVNHVSKSLPPFFVVHGDQDNVVPIAESQRFADEMTKVGATVEFIPVKGGGHDALAHPNAISPTGTEVLRRLADFLQKHIGSAATK